MHILQVASEIAPVAKVGGLGDVCMGLSRELKWKGHLVDICVPKYDCLDTSQLTILQELTPVRSFFQSGFSDNTVWSAEINGDLQLKLFESHHQRRFFDRGCIYGCHDDIDRFLYFSRCVLDWLQTCNKTPDIIHIHDWQTAAIALLIRQGAFLQQFANTRVVFTIHNFAYQGLSTAEDLDKIGLAGSWYATPERAESDFTQNLNLLKGGIVFSDFTTTVSPTYAKEVMTPEGGMGLHLTLQRHKDKFSGVLNGLDYSYWNPEIDKYLFQNYTPSCLFEKKKNKEAILQKLGMQQAKGRPLVVSICRLVEQKGVEFIKYLLENARKKEIQYIVLAVAPDPAIYSDFLEFAERHKDDPDIRVLLQQEEKLAHQLYAAADLFFMPSRFEPCGLTQLIALKYGSIPIVHHTGGLVDTVFDVEFSEKPEKERNGFSFDTLDYAGVDFAVDRATHLFRNKPEYWQELARRAMGCDFSWNSQADLYSEIYAKVCQTAKAGS